MQSRISQKAIDAIYRSQGEQAMAEKLDKTQAFFKSFADADESLSVQRADERLGVKLSSIPTGSLVLDDILGCGGYPLGRLIQLYGAAGSGKSLMAMLAIKQAQQMDPDTQQVYIDAEQTFNAHWAEKLGLDTSRIFIIDGELAVNGRRCFEMILGKPKEDAKHVYAGKSQEGLLDKIKNKEMNVSLIVLDSLGAIIPPIEDVAAVGKANMTPMARFLTPTFKKLSLEVSKANIPFIIINHKRDNMDPYGADHTYSGGNTYAHFLSANIYFEAVQRKDSMILDEKENKIGHMMRAAVEKSKFGPWPKKCEFKVNFNIGIIDSHEEIAQLALDYNVVKKPSNVAYEYKDTKWVGSNKYSEAIKEDPALAMELLEKVEIEREARLRQKGADMPQVEREEKPKKGKKDV